MREGRDRVVTLATDRTGKILACHVSNGGTLLLSCRRGSWRPWIIFVTASQGFACLWLLALSLGNRFCSGSVLHPFSRGSPKEIGKENEEGEEKSQVRIYEDALSVQKIVSPSSSTTQRLNSKLLVVLTVLAVVFCRHCSCESLAHV